MQASEIFEVLNRHVFDEEKSYLINNVTDNYARFVGIFRSTTPRLKIIQNLLQSREIRFGDALEEIIGKIIADMGYINLEKNLAAEDGKRKRLNCDQYFSTADFSQFFLVEQKVRDDHDSSKKSGQIENFERKLAILYKRHGSKLTGVMYFIDPSLAKNRRYYLDELSTTIHPKYNIDLWLCYNGELFEKLGRPAAWSTLEQALIEWRDTVRQDINLNYDLEPEATVAETQSVTLSTWLSFAKNDLLWTNGVVKCLFPTGEGLQAITIDLERRFEKVLTEQKQRKAFELTVSLLKHRLREYYNLDLPSNRQQSSL
jgi:hypothetical protein